MKAHRTDGVSLVFALIFLAMAGWWLLAQIVDLALPAVGWFLAGTLILVGVLGLFGALRSGRAGPPTTDQAPSGPAPSGSPESGETEPAAPGYETVGQQPYRVGDDSPTRELRYPDDDSGTWTAAEADRDQRDRTGPDQAERTGQGQPERTGQD